MPRRDGAGTQRRGSAVAPDQRGFEEQDRLRKVVTLFSRHDWQRKVFQNVVYEIMKLARQKNFIRLYTNFER